MTSQISIVRKFLSLYSINKTQQIKIGDYYFMIWECENGCPFSLGSFLEINNNIFGIKTWKRTSQTHTKFFKFYIDISDTQEFLNSDDISLVLRYGRVITDDHIIQCFNLNNLYGSISYNDFDEFFAL